MNQTIQVNAEVKMAIKQAWDKMTCYPLVKNEWNKDKPEIGQCAVTSLVIQDFLGGYIVFNQTYDHFWNVLPSGSHLDLTRKQFENDPDLKIDAYVNRYDILFSASAKEQNTYNRYKLLKRRIHRLLSPNYDLLLKK